MHGALQHAAVRRAAGEDVPQHDAHAPFLFGAVLFVRDHLPHAASGVASRLDLACHSEQELPDPIVRVDLLADGQVVILQLFKMLESMKKI